VSPGFILPFCRYRQVQADAGLPAWSSLPTELEYRRIEEICIKSVSSRGDRGDSDAPAQYIATAIYCLWAAILLVCIATVLVTLLLLLLLLLLYTSGRQAGRQESSVGRKNGPQKGGRDRIYMRAINSPARCETATSQCLCARTAEISQLYFQTGKMNFE
jgi:hypothetical protein